MATKQSWEAWKGLEQFERTNDTVALVLGSTSVSAEIPMDVNHPFYPDWQAHLAQQTHVGI